jgi:GATA-binding protein
MNSDTPQTHEQLIAANSSLKTRVRELELINELFRGRLSQLEQQEAAARRGHEVADSEQTGLRAQLEESRESEAHLRGQLEETHRRENSLKRRLDELELELKAATATKTARDAAQALDSQNDESERPYKKARIASPAISDDADAEEATETQPADEPTSQAPEPTMIVDS